MERLLRGIYRAVCHSAVAGADGYDVYVGGNRAGASIIATANRLQYASNQTKLNVVTQLFDRGFLTHNQGLEIFNMSPVEDGDKHYIRKEYTEVSNLDAVAIRQRRATMAITPETRDYRTFEVRALDTGEEDKQYRVEGYAAVFDEETVLYEYDGIEYKEVIDRSAFTGAEMRDVVMNYNHGGKPVARTKNGTLQLTVDTRGLRISADLSGTEEGRRLYEEIRGGYLDQMSFAFTVNKQEYDRAKHLRRITGFKRVFDVAAVDIPAYDGTSIAARSWAKAEAEREHAEADKRRRLAIKLKTCGFPKEEK